MNLYALLQRRMDAGRPVRVTVIGAGKFGSMFLAQVPHTRGLEVAAIADLSPERARKACQAVGWSSERIAATAVTEDAAAAVARVDVEVVVQASGNPAAAIGHARAATAAAKHIFMVNVAAAVLAAPLPAREAAQAGVVYSLAFGDLPALICEMVDGACAVGMEVV